MEDVHLHGLDVAGEQVGRIDAAHNPLGAVGQEGWRLEFAVWKFVACLRKGWNGC